MTGLNAKRSAGVGFGAWLLFLLTNTADSAPIELIHKIVFFAILVIVPLGLSLVAPSDRNSLYKLVILIQPIAALLTITSFFLDKGVLSATLASSWLILTGLVALYGVTRLIGRGGIFPLPESSIDAGLMYLPVAGVWLVVYRLGVQPLGYGETIILLTVVHFHFAGFGAPIIAGLSGRALATRNYPRKMFGVSVFAIVAAMPLVAAGITFSPWLGFVGALLISIGLLLLAVLTFGWVIPAVASLAGRVLLAIGALSTCAAMVLACLYAYSLATKILIIDIPTMALTHGLLNAFGFVTCSLLAWTVITQRQRRAI